MNSNILRILLIEDNPGDARLLEEMLKETRLQFKLYCVGSLSAAIVLIGSNNFDVILLDLGLPDSQGLGTLSRLNKTGHVAPVIVLTGISDEDRGIEAVKEGAQDYLIKGQVNSILIARSINYSIERNKIEMTLRESEERYRSLVTNMSDGFAFHKIITNDENIPIDYEFIEVNDAFEQMTGLKKEQIIGKKVTEALPGIETDPMDWIGKYGTVALTGKELKMECYSSPLKKWYYVSAYSPARGYFAVIFDDITQRKRVEKELHASEEKFKKAFHSSPQSISITTLNDGRIIEMNDSITKSLGFSREEAIGHTTMELGIWITPEDRIRFVDTFKQNGNVRNMELELRAKNGNILCMLLSSELIEVEGKACMLSTFYDITERKRAVEELRKYRDNLEEIVKERTAQLNKKNEELEQFNKLFVGRELRMIELKKKIAELEKSSGKEEKHG